MLYEAYILKMYGIMSKVNVDYTMANTKCFNLRSKVGKMPSFWKHFLFSQSFIMCPVFVMRF